MTRRMGSCSDELLRMLHAPIKGNGLVQLAHQLITAKLDVANGGIASIASTIAEADALIGALVVPPIGDGSLPPSQTSSLADALDAYASTHDGGGCAGGGCGQDGGGCPPAATCGNGIVETGEQCDDGNTVGGDGCSATCTQEATCGNGVVEPGEQCDDGNTVGGDGCSSACLCECPPGG